MCHKDRLYFLLDLEFSYDYEVFNVVNKKIIYIELCMSHQEVCDDRKKRCDANVFTSFRNEIVLTIYWITRAINTNRLTKSRC